MMAPPARNRLFVSYVFFYLALASVVARAMFEIRRPADVRFMLVMFGIYLLTLVVEPWLITRSPLYLHGIILLQVGVALALLVLIDEFDFFALLFIPPCTQSILTFSRKVASLWIGAIILVMAAALLMHFPIEESVGYVIVYPAAIFLFCGLGYLSKQALEAQQRSEALLADLQAANRKLRAYSEQVQELAAAAERNRLARELHDSVTQIIFGLTLSAQAARILLDKDPARVAGQLDHMQTLAQNALAEMRALIQQLHPRTVTEDGLPSALRRLAAERQANDGLMVDVQVQGEQRLPAHVEEGLYHIVQEALNNVVKHAGTDRAAVALYLEDAQRVRLCIEDRGAGFDPSKLRASPGHLGLVSMEERVQALGGILRIESTPGKGTRLSVELAPAQEVEHAG